MRSYIEMRYFTCYNNASQIFLKLMKFEASRQRRSAISAKQTS